MKTRGPKPAHVPKVAKPRTLNEKLYRAGYEHGLVSNTLTDLRASFRCGFRRAKLEQQEERRKQGVVTLPYKIKIAHTESENGENRGGGKK